jgi:predicted ATPase
LWVLDNCEYLITGAAGLVRAIVRRCPGVTVVATSREPLGSTASGFTAFRR